MNEIANRTRIYVQERLDHLRTQVATESVQQNGPMLFTMNSMITELKQVQNVLDGGKSIFEQVKELDHAG